MSQVNDIILTECKRARLAGIIAMFCARERRGDTESLSTVVQISELKDFEEIYIEHVMNDTPWFRRHIYGCVSQTAAARAEAGEVIDCMKRSGLMK